MDHTSRVLYVSPGSLPLTKASGLAETAQALTAAKYVQPYENALKSKRGGRHG
jgi:hypothetical protein